MLDPKIFLKLPLNFQNKFYIYPPSMKEVIGNNEFGMYQKIFTMSQEEIEDDFVEKGIEMEKVPTPFEYLFASCYNNQEF